MDNSLKSLAEKSVKRINNIAKLFAVLVLSWFITGLFFENIYIFIFEGNEKYLLIILAFLVGRVIECLKIMNDLEKISLVENINK